MQSSYLIKFNIFFEVNLFPYKMLVGISYTFIGFFFKYILLIELKALNFFLRTWIAM